MGELEKFGISGKDLKQRSHRIMLRVLHDGEIERFGNKLTRVV
jgi:hypothetical protein